MSSFSWGQDVAIHHARQGKSILFKPKRNQKLFYNIFLKIKNAKMCTLSRLTVAAWPSAWPLRRRTGMRGHGRRSSRGRIRTTFDEKSFFLHIFMEKDNICICHPKKVAKHLTRKFSFRQLHKTFYTNLSKSVSCTVLFNVNCDFTFLDSSHDRNISLK